MPTLLRKDGFRFFFYSNESEEPVHVQKGDAEGKIWLMPKTEVCYMNNFNQTEIRQISLIIFEYAEQFKTQWNGYFNQ